MKEVAKKSLVIKAFLGAVAFGLLLAMGTLGPTLQPPQARAASVAQMAFTACGSAATISDCVAGYEAGYNGTPEPQGKDSFYTEGYKLGLQAKAASGGTTSGTTPAPPNVSTAIQQKAFNYCNNAFSADVGNCTNGYEWGYTGAAKPSICNSFCVGGYAEGKADLGNDQANAPSGCPAHPTADELLACQAGANGGSGGKTETQSCQSYSGSTLTACQAAWTAANSAATPTETPEQQCEAEAVQLGWILCPAIDLANKTINTVVSDILVPQLKIVPPSDATSEYAVWQNIRTLANVFFVVAFMVVIFANTLQFNIETYAIKKMLPRLVAAVVLVQFSFVISAVIVDIGNIFGDGIAGLINLGITSHLHYKDAAGHTIVKTFNYGSGGGGVLNSLGLVLVAGSALLVGAIVGVPTLVLIVLTGLISVLGVLITLVARRFILILLLIVSPLAFAAWVLPNTENYFKMWLRDYVRLSLMYPIIMLLLSVASIGTVAVQGDANAGFIAAIFPIIAFFMIPMTFKWAGSAMGFASGKISGVTKQASGKAGGAWKGSQAYTALEGRRGARKQQKLIQTLGSEGRDHGVRRWAAGLKTRGDLLGGRSLEVKNGRPTLRGDRAGVLERQAKVQKSVMEAEQQKNLREQYDTLTLKEAATRLKEVPSKVHAEAIAGVAVMQGAGDQAEFLGGLVEKYRGADGKLDVEGASKAVSRVRELRYGPLLEAAPTLTGLDVTKGDDIDGNGVVTFGADLAASTSKKPGDKLTGQTGPGWRVISSGKMTKGEMVRLTTMGDDKVAPDVKARVQDFLSTRPTTEGADTVYGPSEAPERQANIGRMLISDAARESIIGNNNLSAKVRGTAAEQLIERVPGAGVGGSGGGGGGASGGGSGSGGGGSGSGGSGRGGSSGPSTGYTPPPSSSSTGGF